MNSFLSTFIRIKGKKSPMRNRFLIQNSGAKFSGKYSSKSVIRVGFRRYFDNFIFSMKFSNIGNSYKSSYFQPINGDGKFYAQCFCFVVHLKRCCIEFLKTFV